MKTRLIHDCAQFARSVAACGGSVPDSLQHLLSSYEVLTAPTSTERPETAIVTAALGGKLDQKMLARLLPAATAAHAENQYRQELARTSEHTLVGQWHRELERGGADEIILSLRPVFDKHAAGIAKAKSLFTSESSPEFVLQSGEAGTIEAWQQLGGHVQIVTKIAAVVSQFGCMQQAMFPLVRLFAAGETFKLDDRALMATTGGLVGDSAEFNKPGDFHKNSAFFRAGGLHLHTIAEAQARHDEWAAFEHDRIHSGPRGGRVGDDGVVIYDEVPPNPYRREEANA
jgi:hypothetical protein